jgi:Flp pilus assembly protein TadD
VAKNNLAMRLSEDPATASEALTLAQQLKQALPDSPEINDTVGWVHHKNGMHESAIRYLESASSKSKNAAFRYHLAIAYFGAGRRELGNRTLNAALAIDPNAPEAALARRAAESAR